MAASTRRGVVRLQPPGKLGAAFASVLLHEMLHVLLQQGGQKMALWEEEGRVMLLAGEACPPAPLRPETEMALTSPRNEAEMRTAYRNACAAVALRQQGKRPAVRK
jgi:hypothetical protein